MKDNLSLIAAAAGGFMLAVAASGIIKSAPVTFLNSSPTLNSTQTTNIQTSALSASGAVQTKILNHK